MMWIGWGLGGGVWVGWGLGGGVCVGGGGRRGGGGLTVERGLCKRGG